MTTNFHSIIFNLGARTMIRGRSAGAYRIATELRSHDWDVEVVDFFYFWKIEELKQLCNLRINTNTKFIGFSHIFTEWPELARELVQWLKETHPNIIIIFGSNTYQTLYDKNIDYYISGYGEYGVMELLRWKFGNGSRPIITPMDDNKVILSQKYYTAAPFRNPIILYEDRDYLMPFEWVGVEFSRGCKFKCAYCNFPMLGVKGDWTRDASSFELQMQDAYDRFGINRYIVSDETFNDRTEKITKFADVVEKLDIGLFFSGHIRGDLLVARPHEKEELLRMGFRGQFYGLESFNYESAKTIGKGMQSDKLKQGMLDVRDYFTKHGSKQYRGTIALIAGLPYESEESFISSYNWLLENWSDQSIIINPLEIYQKSALNVSLFEQSFEKYGYREITDIPTNLPDMVNGPQLSRNVMIWENDYTNYYRIRKIVKDVMSSGWEKFSRISFNLSADLSGNGIEHTLSLKGQEIDEEEHKKFAAEYIRKKLQ